MRQSPDGLEVERKGEQRFKKKSGFEIENVGLKRENICFRSKNVGLQSEKKD